MVLYTHKDEEGKISSLYDSSNILASKYDPNNQKLVIIFHNGGQYLYDKVKKSVFDEFQEAKSQGKAIHTIIKQHHTTKLETVDTLGIKNDILRLKK